MPTCASPVMSIPCLNYSGFCSGSREQKERFARALVESFENTGFCKLECHGFDLEQLNDMFTWAKNFFDQPLEVKQQIPNDPGPKPMRGYTPWRVEEVGKLSFDDMVRSLRDSKEHFDQGSEGDTEYPNQWPSAPELAGFRSFMTAFYQQCDEICLTLMKALELAWGIDDGSLVARCKPSATDLRLTHYPAIAVEEMAGEKKTCRIAPHTDFGPVTLLFQDGTGGLEVQDRTTGSLVPVNPDRPTEMIVNVGDTLTRWTNGKILGGVHQVTVPQAMKGMRDVIIPSRISMAYLFKAGRDVSLGPLPKFVSATNPARFSDMTAGEYQSWRNSMIYSLDNNLFTKEGKKLGAPGSEVLERSLLA